MSLEPERDKHYRRALTDAEIAALWPGSTTWEALFVFARNIEKAHGIEQITPDDQALLRVQEDI